MFERKLASVLLNGVIVFGGVVLGAGIRGLKHEIDLLTMQNKLQAIIIESQQKTIKHYCEEKEKEKES